MKYFAIAALMALCSSAVSALPMTAISPSQAKSNEGECVTVEGRAKIHDDPLRAGIDVQLGTGHDVLIGYILVGNEAQFPSIGAFDGKIVDITGVVQWYNSVPEIKMVSSHQLIFAPTPGQPRPILYC